MDKLDLEISVIDIEEILDEIPERYSQVLRLYYLENLTQKGISEKLNIAISITRQRLGIGNYLLRKKTGCTEFLKAQKILYGKKEVQ